MSAPEQQSDADLLLGGSADAFGAFYRRHLGWVLRWLHGHVRDRELAADLAGEVFARALQGRQRFEPGRGGAEPWLQAIARNVMIDSLRRGRVEDGARRELGIRALPLTDDDLARVDELIDQARGEMPATIALTQLPPGQVEAIRAHVLDEEEYGEIARRLDTSPSVVRQRVSRGLRAMRAAIEEEP
jgi:RNA polymerase sigma-70 factor (ECF subfamily)